MAGPRRAGRRKSGGTGRAIGRCAPRATGEVLSPSDARDGLSGGTWTAAQPWHAGQAPAGRARSGLTGSDPPGGM